MKTARIIMHGLALMVIAMLVMQTGAAAQDSTEPEQDRGEQAVSFSKEELSQMLAPIALYPDSLIAQILMASTYPVEIVQAERWLRQNKDLKGDALDSALLEKSWDPSIKSLCHFPDLLFAMSDKLDQTRKLGDAFLSQQEEVMATIQELRRKAEEQGNLKTTAEQKVIVEKETIRIEPADTQIVYVPVYDPLYVYGPWWYPAYPPYYWYYPPYPVIGGQIIFGPRFFWGVGFFSWSWFDWHHHHIIIDFRKAHRFHRHHFRRDSDRPFSWRHDFRHRRGVAYRDGQTSERFSGRKPMSRPSISPETRGFPPKRFERKAVEPSRSPVERPGQAVDPRVRPERERIQPGQRRDTPFRGVGEGGFERRSGERGRESRGLEFRRPEMRRQESEIQRPAPEMRRPGGDMRPGGGMRQRNEGAPGGRQGGGFRR
ncbi:MAG: DUF3300 domain-containing protein [Thermodesulfovibrionales bacterium]|jgi:hypothetical protein